jgi:hypothetical protein
MTEPTLLDKRPDSLSSPVPVVHSNIILMLEMRNDGTSRDEIAAALQRAWDGFDRDQPVTVRSILRLFDAASLELSQGEPEDPQQAVPLTKTDLIRHAQRLHPEDYLRDVMGVPRPFDQLRELHLSWHRAGSLPPGSENEI